MDAEVNAAWIAAAAAAIVAGVNGYLGVRAGRRQRDTDLMVNALTHFVGGSQERSAGIAALRVLRGPTGRDSRNWRRYGSAVGTLFSSQAIYVLSAGGNRWQAHEVANVIGMVEWLLKDRNLAIDVASNEPLTRAMMKYCDDCTR
jgi:hypothetical protein